MPSCLQSPTPHMCLQPIAVRTDLAIMDVHQLSVFVINCRLSCCIWWVMALSGCKLVWEILRYLGWQTVLVSGQVEQWGALFPAEWREHRRPCSQLHPFRSSFISSKHPNLTKTYIICPHQVVFGVATLLCVRTIFNNILESVGPDMDPS